MQLVFGEIIRDESQKQAYNMKPSVRVVKYELDEVPVFGAFNELKDALMADKGRMEAQREEIRKLMKEGRKAVLILSERVAECQTYAAWLKEDGIPHVLITGETKPVEDQASVDALLKAGIPFVIVGSVGKMSRGADVPAIDTVCLFSALQFRGTVVQAVGRSLRTFAGKLPPMIVDWNDLPILKSQASARRTSYRKEYGKDVSIDMVLPAIEELTEALPEVSLGEGLHNVGRGDSQEPQLALL
jgi:superfamily II DNA or RNA helicase